MTAPPKRPAFGTLLTSHMAVAAYKEGRWGEAEIKPVAPIELSPAAHVLHYASTCFEGFKAFRHADGSIHVFRMDRHIQRMRQSARQLVLPEPDAAQLAQMVRSVIERCRDVVPEAPGALYLRPILIGTTANIGAAATPTSEALLMVLASPVWDYFAGGMKPLRILVDDEHTRSAAQMGMVKTGGNYAAALGPTLSARAKFQVDQVLFCPGGEVQETGAANGAPRLARRAHYARWSRVLGAEFNALQARAAQAETSLFSDYGATDPAEFFAVISEVFFEQPQAMASEHPALYRELTQFYRLDPLSW